MTTSSDFRTDPSNVAQVGDVGTIQLHLDHGCKTGLFASSGSISDFNDQVSEPLVFNRKFSSTYKFNKKPSATSVPGRIIPPYLADVFGHFNAFTLCACGSGVAILALWLPFNYYHSHTGLVVFALIYGFPSGALVSLFMPCVAKLGKLETLGQRFGTFQIAISIRWVFPQNKSHQTSTSLPCFLGRAMANFCSCLTGLPIEGALLHRQHDDDYSGLQIFAALSLLLGTLFLGMSTYFLSKQRETWKV